MPSVQEIYESPQPIVGKSFLVQGLLLGKGFNNQYIADSPEGYARKIALPILSGSLFERLFESGVSPIGGGRFSFFYKAVVQGEIGLADRGEYKYGLVQISSLVVFFENREITVIPAAETNRSVP
jgi:hypothetical protein